MEESVIHPVENALDAQRAETLVPSMCVCPHCNTSTLAGAAFCAFCGKPMAAASPYLPYATNTTQPPWSGFSIAGFMLSFFPLVNWVGVVLAAIGLMECSTTLRRGKHLALAGLGVTAMETLLFFLLVGIVFIS